MLAAMDQSHTLATLLITFSGKETEPHGTAFAGKGWAAYGCRKVSVLGPTLCYLLCCDEKLKEKK